MKNQHLEKQTNRLRTLAALRGRRRTRYIAHSLSFGVEQLESRVLLSGVDITAGHYNTANTDANLQESVLTPANVNTTTFGKLFSTPVDGQVYSQTLLVNAVTIQNGSNTSGGAAGVHDVVYVTTEANSLYAIDAHNGAVLWYRPFANATNAPGNINNTLGASVITPLSTNAVASADISPSIGITGTPVIDAANNTLYVVTQTADVVGGQTYYVFRLHAINITNGTDVVAPFLIGSTGNGVHNTPLYVYGTGYNYGSGSDGVVDPYNGTGRTVVQFDSLRQNQRAGLSLVNGTLYVEWAAHGLVDPYHGWVASWNVSNLQSNGMVLSGVLCTTPNSGRGGVWMGAAPLAFEPDGSAFYFSVGNGNSPAPTIGLDGFPTNANYSDGIVKAALDPTTSPTNQGPNGWGIKIVDYFLPFDVASLDTNDSDLGSGGLTLLPPSAGIPGHPNLMIAGGKSGKLYVLDRDNLGHFQTFSDSALNSVPNGQGKTTPPVLFNGMIGSAVAYFNGQIYSVAGFGGAIEGFTINSNGLLSFVSQTQQTNYGYIPGSAVISANGATNAILWMSDRANNQIHALNPANLAVEYWNSNQAPGGADALGAVSKYEVPTVANGQVFVGIGNALVVYGLKASANAAPAAPVLSAATPLSNAAISLNWTDSTPIPNTATSYQILLSTDGVDYSPVATAAAGTNSITVSGLAPATTYYFQVVGINPFGNSTPSNTRSAATTGTSAAISFPSGFGAAAASLMQLNGNASFGNNALVLIDNHPSETSSAFYNTQQNITQFATQFTFSLTGTWPLSNGFTFTIQNDLLTAMGQGGTGLGYGAAEAGGNGGIPQSIAIKFDVYSTSGNGSTGLYTNGQYPVGNAIELASTGVNLRSYDQMQCNISYNGTTLTVIIKDLLTGATATQNYTVNIPAIVGGNNAWIGFTGGDGAQVSLQQIHNWTFTSTGSNIIVSPNAPSGLSSGAATTNSASLNWIANSNNQTGYYLDRSTNAAFTANLVTQTLSALATSFTDTAAGLNPGASYFYRLRAFNTAGSSANSNAVKVTLPALVPAPTVAPSGVYATATNGGAVVYWGSVAGAGSYKVSYGTTSGGPYTTIVPGILDTTSTITGLAGGTTYYFVVAAVNTGGTGPNSAEASATPTTPPPSVPTGITAAPGNAAVVLNWSTSPLANSYDVSRATTPGGPYTLIADDLPAVTFTDTTVVNGTTYYYIVSAQGVGGQSANSGEVAATPTGVVTTIDYSGGFNNVGSAIKLNGNAGLSGGKLNLTSNLSSQVASAFFTTQQNVASFTTQFDFQITGSWPLGDGMTFVIQRSGLSAIGQSGGGLGYGAAPGGNSGGIANSVAIKFDVYDNQGEGTNSTGLYINGAAPANTGSVNLNGTGFNMRSYNPSRATLTYNGTTLSVILKDLVTGATAVQTYTVNIPAVIGGSSAWVGFTAGSGSITSTEQVLNWTYTTSAAGPVAPQAPTGVTATPGNGQVVVSWSAAAGATSYNLKYAATSGGPYTTISGITGTTSTVPSLTNGTPYYFVVSAQNAVGPSSNSAEVSATPAAPVLPGTPTGLSPTAGNGQITLAWTAVAGATSYNVRYATVSGGPYTTITGVTLTSKTITGLTNGTPYFFVVSAVNAVGEGSDSTQVTSSPFAAALPAAPGGLNASAGNAQVALSWNAVAGATSYNLKYSAISGGPYTVITGIIGTSSNVSSLVNGTPYYFVVSAVNGTGEGVNSAQISAAPIAPAGPVTTLDFSSGFDNAATALQLNGNAALNGSELVLTNNLTSRISSVYAKDQQNIAAFSTQFDFQINGTWPLGDGMTFIIQRSSLTAIGAGGGGLGYGNAPGFPTGGITNSIAIKFDVFGNNSEGNNSTGLYTNGAAPTNNGSVDLSGTGFNMRSYDLSRATMTYDGITLTVVLKDLVTGATATQNYTIDIPAVIGGSNAWVGFTAASGALVSVQKITNWTFAAAPSTPPTAPSSLSATPGNNSVALTWSAVQGASSYNVKYATTSGGPYTTLTGITSAGTTLNSLTNGVPYYFVVSAVNGAGEGNNASEISATPVAPAIPNAPTGLAPTAGNAQVALSWSPVPGAATYTVKGSTTPGGPYTTLASNLTGTSATLTGLTNNTPYYFVVSASNVSGESPDSSEVTSTPVVPVIPAPGQPTGLAATAGNGQVGLTWAAVSGATSYTVKYATTPGGPYTSISNIPTAGTTINSLTNGTLYYFTVSASNAGGEGPNAAEISATPNAVSTTINYTSGFASAGSALTLNGSVYVNAGVLLMTQNNTSQVSSVYATSQQNVAAFTTQFDFQITGTWPLGDGFTFVIQRQGLNALGQSGGGLGYGATSTGAGISNSIAIKFDVFSNNGEGNNSTGLFVNGATPTNNGSVSLDGTGFNMRSYNPSRATITYNGTTLTVVLKDLVNGTTATQNYTVNIPALIGGTTAWVGFTAGSGALIAHQNILNWTYTA